MRLLLRLNSRNYKPWSYAEFWIGDLHFNGMKSHGNEMRELMQFLTNCTLLRTVVMEWWNLREKQ